MESQALFLFPEGPGTDQPPPDLQAELFREIAAVCRLPVGQRVRLQLRGADWPELRGRLMPERTPDLPFDAARPLHLTIAGVAFRSLEISAWSLED